MIPKPKYMEHILSIKNERAYKSLVSQTGREMFLECDVICECGANHFVGYKNTIERTDEEKAYEKELISFHRKYNNIQSATENGVPFLYGMKGLFREKVAGKIQYKKLDSTEIVKVKCSACGKEYVLFDSRFHGYDACISERNADYDNVEYSFTPVVWKKHNEGIATYTVIIQNDESLEKFIFNSEVEVNEVAYSNAFGWIAIEAINQKTKVKKTILSRETG